MNVALASDSDMRPEDCLSTRCMKVVNEEGQPEVSSLQFNKLGNKYLGPSMLRDGAPQKDPVVTIITLEGI